MAIRQNFAGGPHKSRSVQVTHSQLSSPQDSPQQPRPSSESPPLPRPASSEATARGIRLKAPSPHWPGKSRRLPAPASAAGLSHNSSLLLSRIFCPKIRIPAPTVIDLPESVSHPPRSLTNPPIYVKNRTLNVTRPKSVHEKLANIVTTQDFKDCFPLSAKNLICFLNSGRK